MDIIRSDPIPIPKQEKKGARLPWKTSPPSPQAADYWYRGHGPQYSLDQNPPTPPSFPPPRDGSKKDWDKLVMDKLAVSPSVYDNYLPPLSEWSVVASNLSQREEASYKGGDI